LSTPPSIFYLKFIPIKSQSHKKSNRESTKNKKLQPMIGHIKQTTVCPICPLTISSFY